MRKIGITEKGDPAIDLSWINWVQDSGKPAILITKNPSKLSSLLNGTENIIIHCTITGMGSTVVEPNVPAPENSIQAYLNLINKFGSDSVVLRIDPIIPTIRFIDRLKVTFANIPAYTRIRISFLDNYSHVKERFSEANIPPLDYKFHASLELRQSIHKDLEDFFDTYIEVCGEPGMKNTACISQKDCRILGVMPVNNTPNQRACCQCLSNKKELLNNKKQCPHGCLYCYWK